MRSSRVYCTHDLSLETSENWIFEERSKGKKKKLKGCSCVPYLIADETSWKTGAPLGALLILSVWRDLSESPECGNLEHFSPPYAHSHIHIGTHTRVQDARGGSFQSNTRCDAIKSRGTNGRTDAKGAISRDSAKKRTARAGRPAKRQSGHFERAQARAALAAAARRINDGACLPSVDKTEERRVRKGVSFSRDCYRREANASMEQQSVK